MASVIAVLLALVLDKKVGEVSRYHPLVGFGNIALSLERRLNGARKSSICWQKCAGLMAWCLAVLPLSAAFWALNGYLLDSPLLWMLFSGVTLYFTLGWCSLMAHAQAIAQPLQRGDLQGARAAVAMIVSRDTAALDESQIATAATESVLENGADAIFASLFWFCLFGAPGAVLYRLSNTLDAMWGYKNPRFIHFGWAAARMDDLLNFIPARLCALSYQWLGNSAKAKRFRTAQGLNWKSPNAGPVMASGAASLNLRLGGAAPYHGQWQARPVLGDPADRSPKAEGVDAACHLVNRVLLLWLLAIVGLALLGVL